MRRASLGSTTGTAANNVATWRGAFQGAVKRCFTPTYNGQDADQYEADIDIPMKIDGSLASEPIVVAVRGPSRSIAQAVAEERQARHRAVSGLFVHAEAAIRELEAHSDDFRPERYVVTSEQKNFAMNDVRSMNRRRFMTLTGSALAMLGGGHAFAQQPPGSAPHRSHRVSADPDRDHQFRAGLAGRRRRRQRRHAGHHQQSEALGPVRARSTRPPSSSASTISTSRRNSRTGRPSTRRPWSPAA